MYGVLNSLFLSNRNGGGICSVQVEQPSGNAEGEWFKQPHLNGLNSARKSRIGGIWIQVAYVLIDIGCVLANGIIAFVVSVSPGEAHSLLSFAHLPLVRPLFNGYGGFLFLYAVLTVLCCQWQELYRTLRTRSVPDESMAVVKAVSLATLLLTAFVYMSSIKVVSRQIVLGCYFLNAASFAAWRYWKRRIVIRRVEQGIGARNAVIVGAGRIGQALAMSLEQNKSLGYRFRGFLDSNHSGDSRILGKIEDLPYVSRKEFIDEVFITIPSERELVKRIAFQAQLHRLDVKVVPDLFDGLGWHAPLCHVGDFPVLDLHWRPIPTFGLFLKRVFDILLSAGCLILSLPLMAVLAISIKLGSPGPIFYRSRRVGKKGRVFTCYKLRTMVENADVLKDSLRSRNERQGPCFKIKDDPRITSLGKFLRKYSLDELPQIWNVFKGDMSLVGPRPHPLDDYERYNADHLRRLEVKPGITGLWQVHARRDPSFSRNMSLDLEYIDAWNIWLDLKILARTVPAVLQGHGE